MLLGAGLRRTAGSRAPCYEGGAHIPMLYGIIDIGSNTVRLTVPPDAELSKIAVHYLHNAAFAADKTTLRTGADGVSILFAVDMTQPYLD